MMETRSSQTMGRLRYGGSSQNGYLNGQVPNLKHEKILVERVNKFGADDQADVCCFSH